MLALKPKSQLKIVNYFETISLACLMLKQNDVTNNKKIDYGNTRAFYKLYH